MVKLDRRQFIVAGGLGAGVLAMTLAGCSRSSAQKPSTAPTTADGAISWWDQFQPLQKLEESTFAAYGKAHSGASVKHTVYDPNNMGSALQLAQQSNQLPDVFTNVFGVPDMVLVQKKWVTPIELTAASKKMIGSEFLLPGLHVFDGKIYSFPMFSFRQHSTLTYFNKDVVEKAGGDPEKGPATWDDFRSLARGITKAGSGNMYGWIEGLTLTDRIRAHLVDLAIGAGADLSLVSNSADSPGVADVKTGDYVFDSAPFIDSFEFLNSLVKDGSMFPSSTSLDVRTARARWAAGSGGLFFDGSWNVGVLKTQFADSIAKSGVTNLPTPDGKAKISNGPAGGVFWISADSANPGTASGILNTFATSEYATGLAENMDQPPSDLEVVKKADVPALYKRAVSLMSDSVTLAPSAIVKNPNVAAVLAEMRQIRPTLGEIAQGYLGGNISNIKSTLTDYSSKLSTERDRAIKAVSAKGSKTSLDDWVFKDYKAGTDYDASKYNS